MDSLYLCFHGDQSNADSNKISGKRLFRRYVILFGQMLFLNNYRELFYDLDIKWSNFVIYLVSCN